MGPYDTLTDMNDNEVIQAAREIYAGLQTSARWSTEAQELLIAWGAVMHEMSRRGITDTVTEGDKPWAAEGLFQ
jgi:hypothetical protein